MPLAESRPNPARDAPPHLVLAGMGTRGDIGGLISVKVEHFPFEMTCAHPQHRDARSTPPTALSPRPSASAGHRRCSPQE